MPIKIESEKYLHMSFHELIEYIEQLESSMEIKREMWEREMKSHVECQVKLEIEQETVRRLKAESEHRS